MVRAAGDHIVPALKGSLVKAAAGEGTVFQHIVQIRPIQPHHNGGVFASFGEAVDARHPVRESRLGFFEGHGLVVGLVVVVHHPLSQRRWRPPAAPPGFSARSPSQPPGGSFNSSTISSVTPWLRSLYRW